VAVRLLIEALLGRPTQPIALPEPKSRGWPSVGQTLPEVINNLHYHTDAEALVVVVDSDKSPVHQRAHEQPGGVERRCRWCQLHEAIEQRQTNLRPRQGRAPLSIAIGLAVPEIEAWYRCGLDARVTEAAWVQALQSGNFPYSNKSLKRDVYGTDRPSLALATRRAKEEAHRLAQNLDMLEKLFPNGFGALARDVRTW